MSDKMSLEQARAHNEELKKDWQDMFNEGENFLNDYSGMFELWEGDLDFESVLEHTKEMQSQLLKWTECYLRMCAIHSKADTGTAKRARATLEKFGGAK